MEPQGHNRHNRRVEQLRSWLKGGRDAVLIAKQPDLRYLTGFSGEDSMLLVTQKTVLLVTDSRFSAQARRECPSVKVVLRRGSIVKVLARTIRRLSLAHLRLCPAQITVQFDRLLRKSLAGSGLRFMACPSLAETLRVNKDAAELTSIRKAVRIAENAFTWLTSRIRPGITEQRLAAMLEYKIKLLGAEAIAFKTIVAGGPNSALPHAPVGSDVITVGTPIVFDFGAVVDGYCSDLTRTVVIGTIPPRLRKIYRTVLEAQNRALAAITSGADAKAADKRARDHISRSGFGRYFGHSLGHGIGLDVHEQPVLHSRSDQKLTAGMVSTVEPGIYIPGYGGVRIEDDVVITDGGYEMLSKIGKSLEDILIAVP